MDAGTITLQLPARASIGGVDVVIVAAESIAARNPSVDARDDLGGELSVPLGRDPADEIIDQMLQSGGSRKADYLYDREVVRFLVNGFGTKSDTMLLADCVRVFGPRRSPSNSALNRLSMRVRMLKRLATQERLERQRGEIAR